MMRHSPSLFGGVADNKYYVVPGNCVIVPCQDNRRTYVTFRLLSYRIY